MEKRGEKQAPPQTTVRAQILAWGLLAAVAAVTLSPIAFRPETPAPADLERFLACAAVGGAFSIGYPKRWGLMLAVALGAAGVLEVAQNFVPSRHGQFHDASVKAIGAGVGFAVAALLQRAGDHSGTA
jgi:VanZ family protein